MKFKILCEEGDIAFDYDVATAEIKFDELINSNLLPMKVAEGGNQLMRGFDSEAEEIMWMPAIMGG